MEKIYTYENAIVTVVLPKDQKRLREATEDFLRKLNKEGYFNGNSNTSRALDKK